jgi:hypothetical protein
MNGDAPMIRKTVYTKEPRWGVMESLRLVLLFHEGVPWTPGRRAEWLEIAGTEEATTKTLCDHIRAALALGSRCPEKEGADTCAGERLHGLKAGHTLTAADVRDIQTILGELNDEMAEATDAFYRIRMETIREIGGQELVEAIEAKDKALRDKLVANAMAMFEQKRKEHEG